MYQRSNNSKTFSILTFLLGWSQGQCLYRMIPIKYNGRNSQIFWHFEPLLGSRNPIQQPSCPSSRKDTHRFSLGFRIIIGTNNQWIYQITSWVFILRTCPSGIQTKGRKIPCPYWSLDSEVVVMIPEAFLKVVQDELYLLLDYCTPPPPLFIPYIQL